MLTSVRRTYHYLQKHPFASRHLQQALRSYFSWQISSRVQAFPSLIPWVNESLLLAKSGMTGATGNIYAGLHEFNDMGFLLHFLRSEDIFVDVGANIGSYTVLAGKAIGATCHAFEPAPDTFEWLEKNIGVNLIRDKVSTYNMGVGALKGSLPFSKGLDTVNHIIQDPSVSSSSYTEIEVDTLDNLLSAAPALVKIDVEGFEKEVLSGFSKHLSSDTLKAIIIELNGSGKRYGYDDESIHESLLAEGFLPYDYMPLDRNLLRLATYGSFNTIYIRDINFVKTRLKTSPKFRLWGEEI